MSLTNPKFGDVFMWNAADNRQWIMYVGPHEEFDPDGNRPFYGLDLRGEGVFGGDHECRARVPLTGRDWLKWVEVDGD